MRKETSHCRGRETTLWNKNLYENLFHDEFLSPVILDSLIIREWRGDRELTFFHIYSYDWKNGELLKRIRMRTLRTLPVKNEIEVVADDVMTDPLHAPSVLRERKLQVWERTCRSQEHRAPKTVQSSSWLACFDLFSRRDIFFFFLFVSFCFRFVCFLSFSKLLRFRLSFPS